MKSPKRNVNETLDRALRLFSEPSATEMESARDHVSEFLNSSPKLGAAEPFARFSANSGLFPHETNRQWRALALVGLAAAAVLAAVLPAAMLWNSAWLLNAPAKLESVGGTRNISYGEAVRSSAGAILTLTDGSRVEMRSQSELRLERAVDGVRIRLANGSLIVNAAKQGAGHLYEETKDVSVSVVGTVFLVNAEAQGSRVAVIQGEVRVQQGAKAEELRPGDQVKTSASMESRLVTEEISWSRHAEEHLALLQQSAVPTTAAPQSSPRVEFAVVSIKSTQDRPGPGSNSEPIGLGCHGTDGTPRSPWRGNGELVVPQGRCVANGVPFGALMNYAYESPWRYRSAEPAWASTQDFSPNWEVFQIEGAAGDPRSATTTQLRQMLQTMLLDRFKLKIHRETVDIQGYALRIAKNGPKLKEASGDVELPRFGPGIRGKSSLDDLAQFLTQFVIAFANLGSIDGPFVNKTGLTGIYDYEFRLARSAGARGESPAAGPPSRTERAADAVAAISGGMEDQLGIRIEPEKMKAEMIVIDQVEKPSPN
jgi:uncharacterized protein (TIGR03435 family)